MRFSCKKMIALVLSLMLVLSAFAGVLSVGAADPIVVGNISVEDTVVTATTDKQFDVTATVALEAETEYLELAYQLSGLPAGVALSAVALPEGVEGTASAERDDLVYVSVPGAVTTFNIIMTFSSEEIVEAFTLGFSAIDYADVTEEINTLDISDTALVTVAFHQADTSKWSNGGEKHYNPCVIAGCDEKFNENWHNWVEDVTKEATCCEDGSKYKYCDGCNAGWGTSAIPATGEHTYSYVSNDNATHNVICTTSGNTITENEAHTFDAGVCTLCQAACEHTWDEGVVTVEPTCSVMGTATYTCTNCGVTDERQDVATVAHTNDKFVDNGDGTHTLSCSVCNTEAETVEHSYTSGTCVCGAVEPVTGPVLDENITELVHTIAIGDTIGVIFKYQLSSLPEGATSFSLDVNRKSNAGGFNFKDVNDTITTANQIVKQDTLQFTSYFGFELFSLTVPVQFTLHCYDADGVEIAYSKTTSTTLADIATNYHNLSTTGEKAKRVMADLISVGASALTFYTASRPTCDYAQLPVPTIDSSYGTAELGKLASFSSKEGVDVTITGALLENPYFNMRFADNVANKEDYHFEISFYNKVTKKDVTNIVEGSTMTGNASTISAKFVQLPIFAGDSDVTFKLYKSGTTDPIAVNHYCMDAYIAQTLETSTNTALKSLVTEVGKLGQSIRALKNIAAVE